MYVAQRLARARVPAARRGSSSPLVGRRAELGVLDGAPRRRPSRATAGSSASRPRPAWASRASWRSSSATPAGAGRLVAFGECQAFGTKTAVLRLARDLAPPVRPRGRRLPRRADRATRGDGSPRIDPALVARAPLLGAVVGLVHPRHRPDPRRFDAKLRKASLEDLLVERASAPGRAEATVVVVLEDCHWIDELSRDLLRGARPGGGGAAGAVRRWRTGPAPKPGGGLGRRAATPASPSSRSTAWTPTTSRRSSRAKVAAARR